MKGPPPPQYSSADRSLTGRLWSAGAFFTFVLLVGTAGYVALGGGRWTWGDAAYMTVITLSTVGYGETLADMDQVAWARPFTAALILLGTGTLLYLMSTVTAFVVEGDLGGVLRRNRMQKQIESLEHHVIVCGVGATGSNIVVELVATRRPFVVIELNPEKLARLRRECDIEPLHIIGDASEEKVLDAAGIARASGLIAALTDDRDNLFVTFTARAMEPDLRIVAKAVEEDNYSKLQRAGADGVVSPSFIGGMRMVSEMIRPSVVNFLDDMIRDRDDPHRIEEVHIVEGSRAAGMTLREVGLRKHSDALALAIRHADGTTRYNPPAQARLEAGATLVVLVRTSDVPALKTDLS